jgi:hypothetical protein
VKSPVFVTEGMFSEGLTLATSKTATIDTRSDKATRNQLINDVKRLRRDFPAAPISRDYYRHYGKYSDKAIAEYFPVFKDLVKEAGCLLTKPPKAPTQRVDLDTDQKFQLDLEKVASKREGTQKKYNEALHRIKQLEAEQEIMLGLKQNNPQVLDIQPRQSSGHGEAVAVGVFSDWHIEEPVNPDEVGGVNEFSIEIAKARAIKAWQGFVRLYEIHSRDNQINEVIVALLGDFITNRIHEDLAESNELQPTDAMYTAQGWIIGGLEFLLKSLPANVKITVVCHGGNHGRMTKEQRQKTEPGVSIERFMYFNIRDRFRNEKRMTFQIANGYHTFVRLFDKDKPYVIRFHHGHAIKAGGGVGGIYPPVHKAIDNWNKSVRDVNLDVFGHFHQFVDAQNFIVNGSLIGYNSFAVYIKAPFEPPKQAFFLVSKKYRSKTMVSPIFVE